MKHPQLTELESGAEFRSYVEHHPNCTQVRQKGSHMIVKGTQPGIAVIPVHNKDLPTGTRKSVIRMLIAIGLGILILLYLIG